MSNQLRVPTLSQDQGVRAPLTLAPVGAGEAAEVAQVLNALAHPVRLRLLSLIGAHDGGKTCVCDLTVAFELNGPTISHRLKVLREPGLIQSEWRGTWIYYRIVPTALASMAGLFTPELATAGEPLG